MPRIYRLEVSRVGALIDDATPLRHADDYPDALVATGPSTPQPKRGGAPIVSPSRRRADGGIEAGPSSASPSRPVSRTRFYTIGAPSPRYKLPEIDEEHPPYEFPITHGVEPAQQARFEEEGRHYDAMYGVGIRPASAPQSPARSIAVNTPINYFGHSGLRDMSPAKRLESPRNIRLNLDDDDVEDEDNSFHVNRPQAHDISAEGGPSPSVMDDRELSPVNASTYPHDHEEGDFDGDHLQNQNVIDSEPAAHPGDVYGSGGADRLLHGGGRRGSGAGDSPPPHAALRNNNTSGEESPISFANANANDSSGNGKRPVTPSSDHAFQSETKMLVKAPLDISSVLDDYREACVAFNNSQTGPNSVRSRLRSDADIDKLRMVLSVALSCSRALQQLSQSMGHHPIAAKGFRLEEGKDVITDATFEKLLDMQSNELTLLAQTLSTQEDLLRGRKIAEDGLRDYQQQAAANSSNAHDSFNSGGENNLETIAASLERHAEELFAMLTTAFPTAGATEMNLIILCGAIESLQNDPRLQDKVAREQSSSATRSFLSASGHSTAAPPQMDVPQLRKLLTALSKEHEVMAQQRGIAVSDAPSAGGKRAEKSAYKFFVQCPPRTTFGGYFRNARRVAGEAGESPAGQDALRTYIKALDQLRKSIVDPLETVVAAKKPSSSSSSSGENDDGQRASNSDADEAAAKRAKQQAAAATVLSACEAAGKRVVGQLANQSRNFANLCEVLTPAVMWLMRSGGGPTAAGVIASPKEVGGGATSITHTFSLQGLKEIFLSDLCNAGHDYRRAFRKVCEAETVLAAFDDVTTAYVKACYGVGGGIASLPRADSVASGAGGRAASLQQASMHSRASTQAQEAALGEFLEALRGSSKLIGSQIDRNFKYLTDRQAVFKMLARELRFLKKLDQVPLYFPPEFVLTATDSSKGAMGRSRTEDEEEAETTAKLQLLKTVARVNSSMAQACLRALANSLVTITKPDEDPSAKAKAEEDNLARIPLFLSVLNAMQRSEEDLSQALFACKRFLLRRDANAMAGKGRVLGGGSGRGVGGTFESTHAGLFGGSAVVSPDQSTAAGPGLMDGGVQLFGPSSRPVPQLQADLFRANMRKLVDPGVLIYLKGAANEYIRYTISFHRRALDRLLLTPAAGSVGEATTIIPVPFALLEMLTRGPKVNDGGAIGDMQAMRLHFDKKALGALVSGGGVNDAVADTLDSTVNAAANGEREPLHDAGSVRSLVPLINSSKKVLEVFFPGVATFQQWSDAFQMLIDNKKHLGPHVGEFMAL